MPLLGGVLIEASVAFPTLRALLQKLRDSLLCASFDFVLSETWWGVECTRTGEVFSCLHEIPVY
jgi:hypothetical protein